MEAFHSGVIAKFEKVSYAQYAKDYRNLVSDSIPEEELQKIYNNIQLPKRATIGSAGYDFYSPFSFCIRNHEEKLIPTGIKCQIADGWVLCLFPRSGLGFKTLVRLANTCGVIDSDYYNNEKNEGHIMVKYLNDTYRTANDDVVVGVEMGFVQGIFLPFGLAEGDNVTEVRVDGFGSTTQKK